MSDVGYYLRILMTLICIWSQFCWLCHLRLSSVASWLLGSQVWISHWGHGCVSVVYVTASVMNWPLIRRSSTSCVCVCVCVCARASKLVCCATEKNMLLECAQKWLLMLITKVISAPEIWTGCNENAGVHCIVSLSAASYLHRKPVSTLGSYESCRVQRHHKRGWICSVLLNNLFVNML